MKTTLPIAIAYNRSKIFFFFTVREKSHLPSCESEGMRETEKGFCISTLRFHRPRSELHIFPARVRIYVMFSSW